MGRPRLCGGLCLLPNAASLASATALVAPHVEGHACGIALGPQCPEAGFVHRAGELALALIDLPAQLLPQPMLKDTACLQTGVGGQKLLIWAGSPET